MSRRGRPQFVIRCDDETKSAINSAIDYVIEKEKITGQDARSQAFRVIADRVLLGFPSKETPASVASIDAINCAYLRRDLYSEDYLCDETVQRSIKRESANLGSDVDVVIAKCTAHLRKIQEIQDEKIRELLAKASIVNMAKFYKKFISISRDGFDVDCFICAGDQMNFKIIISGDGKTLQCPIMDNQFVDINEVCRIRVSHKGTTPCEHFSELVHGATLDIDKLRREIDVEIVPTPCHSFDSGECPGVEGCTADLFQLAKINKYCPHQYTPRRGGPLLLEDDR